MIMNGILLILEIRRLANLNYSYRLVFERLIKLAYIFYRFHEAESPITSAFSLGFTVM